MRKTNLVERSFVEERRRTKTIPHLWDEQSAVKLVFAVLIRVSERGSQRQFTQLEEKQLKQLLRERGNTNVEIETKTETKKRRSAGSVAA